MAPRFTFLRTAVINLLKRGGYRSIRQGFRELAVRAQATLELATGPGGLGLPHLIRQA